MGNTDARRFTPLLNGNLGYVLSVNSDWLSQATLDTVLHELSELGVETKRPRVQQLKAGLQWFLGMAACMFVYFVVMVAVMQWNFQRSSSEGIVFVPILGFGGMALLAL